MPTVPPCVLRPCEERDLPGLRRLIASISGNLTSLPNEDSFLEHKVFRSLRAFDRRINRPGDDHYFFVLEDVARGEVVGTVGIIARVGGFDPFYSYELRRERFSHAALGVEKELRVLHLKTDHKGPSELCSLYLRPDYRRGGLGRLLSLGRFLFMDRFPERFDVRVIAELRGHLDADGRSPFWEAVGRHFFERDFSAADFLSGLGEKDFIRDLMPRHPIYVTLLPVAVQETIGRVHAEAAPAWRLLLDEGFTPGDEVDIFDAGPLLAASLARVRTVREVRRATLRGVFDPATDDPQDPRGAGLTAVLPSLVANDRLEFRAGLGPVRVREGDSDADGGIGVDLPASLAERLELEIGQTVAFAPAHPARFTWPPAPTVVAASSPPTTVAADETTGAAAAASVLVVTPSPPPLVIVP